MTLMPEVHDALARAVATRAPRRRRLRLPRRAVLLMSGAVVAGGTALAATTGGWHPALGSRDRGPQPHAATSAVPRAQLAALSVLRRPQAPSDRAPLVERLLRVGLNGYVVDGVHVDGIRVVFRTAREVVVLVPVQRMGHLGGRPAQVQRDALCLLSSSLQRARAVRVAVHGAPKVYRFPGGFTGVSASCGSLEQLRSSGIQIGTSPDPSGGLVVNGRPAHPLTRRVTLVPDGVARVIVGLRHARTVAAPVRDNVYQYETDESPAFMGTVWLDRDGHRIDRRR